MRRQSVLAAVAVLAVAAAWFMPKSEAAVPATPAERTQYAAILTRLVQQEDTATLKGDARALGRLFLPDSGTAAAAQEQAEQRLAYLRDWSRARGIRLERVHVRLLIGPMRVLAPDAVRIYAADSAQYFYRHTSGNTALAWFGLGVYHWYVIRRLEGRWYIVGDTFIDPLNQDTRLSGAAHPAVIRVLPAERPRVPISPGALRAIRYAETYCGAAPGCGNDNRYNPAFADYNWHGGDCTNFISQVLHAGGFTETGAWAWDARRHEGTVAWLNAPALVRYFQRTGRMTLFAEGPMPELLQGHNHEPAPIKQLRPGDLIAYYEGGRVVHMALVVGYDLDGYPVVVSHSADRFREPWDLGWDRTTRFLFFHVHYVSGPHRSPPSPNLTPSPAA